jgi:hypothetical protein
MKRRLLILLITLTTLISGCVTVRVETRIKKDGSGTRSFVLALDKSVISMLEGVAQEAGVPTDDIWGAARADAQAIEGAQVEDYSEDDVQGIRVTIPFASVEELQALSSGEGVEGVDVVTVSQDGHVMTLSATVNVGEVATALTEVGDQNLEGFQFGEIDLLFTYAVEVEGRILEYTPQDAAVVEGHRVTWDLSGIDAAAAELMIQWDANDESSPPIFPLLVALLAVLALVTCGVILIRRGKQGPVHTPADGGQESDGRQVSAGQSCRSAGGAGPF